MTGIKIFSVSLMHAEIHGVWSVMYHTLILGILSRKQRLLAFHRGVSGSIPGQSMWHL